MKVETIDFRCALMQSVFRATRATLVYPHANDSIFTNRQLLNEHIGTATVRIDSLALPMAQGPDQCRRLMRDNLVSAGRGLENVPS